MVPVGVLFYAFDKIKFFHSIWHIFVLCWINFSLLNDSNLYNIDSLIIYLFLTHFIYFS